MSLMAEVGQKAFNLGVPLAVHLDVTYRCNERCVHCYLDHDDHGEMTTAEIKGVLEQLAKAGVFFSPSAGAKFFCGATSSIFWSMRGGCRSTSRSRPMR